MRNQSARTRPQIVRRILGGALLCGVLLLAPANPVFAQDDPQTPPETPTTPETTIDDVQFAPWIAARDWPSGAILAALGLVGALITLFPLAGGTIPGTAGSAQIDADTASLKRASAQLDHLLQNPPAPHSTPFQEVEVRENNLRQHIRSERWQLFFIAGLLYAILGAAIAALLARDLLQALVIGAGWSGFIGAFGLKHDSDERKTEKDEALNKTLQKVEVIAATAANQDVAMSLVEDAREDVARARAL